jgi:hypothetical protein
VIVTSILVLKAILAALVFALARHVATAPVAAVTTALLVVVWGTALALQRPTRNTTPCRALAGLLSMAAATAERRRRALAVAGLWIGVAATFKHSSACCPAGLVLAALADTAPAPRPPRCEASDSPLTGRGVRRRRRRDSTQPGRCVDPQLASYLTVAVVAVPFLGARPRSCASSCAGAPTPISDAQGARDIAALAGFFALRSRGWRSSRRTVRPAIWRGTPGGAAEPAVVLPLPRHAARAGRGRHGRPAVTAARAISWRTSGGGGARDSQLLAGCDWPSSTVPEPYGLRVPGALPLLAVAIGMFVVPRRSADRGRDESDDVPRSICSSRRRIFCCSAGNRRLAGS